MTGFTASIQGKNLNVIEPDYFFSIFMTTGIYKSI